jgi:hypothetical protein
VAATLTATPSATAPAASATPSPVLTATLTPTRSVTPSYTASPVGPGPATATPTALVGSTGGPNEVLEAVPWPQPNPKQFRVKLAGPSDALRIQVYTRGYVLATSCEVHSSFQAGWNSAPVPTDLDQLPAGTYFFRVQSLRQGQVGLSDKAGRLVLIK